MTGQLIRYKSAIMALFTCQNSGNCCKAPGYVYVTPSDIKKMAAQLNLSIESFKSHFVINHRGWSMVSTPTFRTNCFLNKQNKCDVYESRPNHCKTYPDWPDIWKSDEALINEADSCKGLKTALTKLQQSIKDPNI